MSNTFLFLSILLNLTRQLKLVYDFDASNQNVEYWKSNLNLAFTQCNGIKILGGYTVFDMNTELSILIRFLDPHYRLRIQATFWRIDSWNSDKINFDIDGIRQFQKTYQYSNSASLCGMTQFDDQMDLIQFEFDHNQNNAFIKLSAIDNGDNDESWGIQKFQVYILECRYDLLVNDCCDYLQILAQNQAVQLGIVQYVLNLPVHTQLKVQLYYFGSFNLHIDSQFVSCIQREPFKCEIENILHRNSQVNLNFQGVRNSTSIRDLKVFIDNCNCGKNYGLPVIIKECELYSNLKCIKCNDGWQLNAAIQQCQTICGDNLIRGDEECEDNNDVPFDGCYQCKFQCDLNCDKCIFGQCSICKQGFTLNQNLCELKCSDDFSKDFDSVIIVDKQSLLRFFPKQNSCQFKIESLPIRSSYYFDYQTELIKALNNQSQIKKFEYQYIFSSSDSIQQQIKAGKSQSNILELSFLKNGQPEQICGNKLIEGFEQCDDGNYFPFDGCYECQFQCDYVCESCQFGVCIKCQQYYEIDDKNICQPIFNDKVLVPYSSNQCEDENKDDEDGGCIKCQSWCSEYCLICNETTCFQCESNLSLINKTCPQQFFCVCKNGFEFIDNKCQIKCDEGFQSVENICVVVCGDQKVIPDIEECDDGNFDPYDGCFDCKFSCPLNCQICIKGECKQCFQKYQKTDNLCTLIQTTNETQIIENNSTYTGFCGNGIIDNNDEKCDDGNSFTNDGCYQCDFEENFVCRQTSKNQLTQCFFSKEPKLEVTFIKIQNNLQYLKIGFSQKVKLQEGQQFLQHFEMKVENIDGDKQKLKIVPINELNETLSWGEYLLTIEILDNFNYKPKLLFSLNQKIFILCVFTY